MKQDQMLMLVVAFLFGLFFKQITGSVCGNVEGLDKNECHSNNDCGIRSGADNKWRSHPDCECDTPTWKKFDDVFGGETVYDDCIGTVTNGRVEVPCVGS